MKYIAWDFDGTLARRPGMWSAAIAEAAASEGFHFAADILRPHLQCGFPWHSPDEVRSGRESDDQWWERLELLIKGIFVNQFHLSDTHASCISRQVRSIYADASRWHVFEDVRHALERLSADGWSHMILSNHIPELDELVNRLDLGCCFEAIFSSGRTGIEKPNPAAFGILRDYAGMNSRIVMIGDSWEADIHGAMSFGLEAILVRGHHPRSPFSCLDLQELPALLVNSARSGGRRQADSP